MMQEHPIELVCDCLAEARVAFGRGALGLMAGLGLIALMWLGAMRPAGAASAWTVAAPPVGATLGAAVSAPPVITVTTLATLPHAQTARSPGPSGTASFPTSLSVCRMEIDVTSPDPLATGCAPPPLTN